MEVDKEFTNSSRYENPKMIDAFKPEYEEQKLRNNINFKKFKESIIKKYGNHARIFYCTKDKIYFYYDDSKFPYLEGICPLCKWRICYFCSSINWEDCCCLRKRAYYLLNVDALIFLDSYPKKEHINYNFSDYLFYALVPYINCIFFFGGLHVFIYKLKTNIKTGSEYNGVEDYMSFESVINGCYDHMESFGFIVTLDILTLIILAIPLFFLNLFFTIILIIISIPFKFYPIKYLFGIGFRGIKETTFME